MTAPLPSPRPGGPRLVAHRLLPWPTPEGGGLAEEAMHLPVLFYEQLAIVLVVEAIAGGDQVLPPSENLHDGFFIVALHSCK